MKFEGEYLNGEKVTGKLYDKNGNIIYEINDGTGKGKETNDNGELIFEGEYLNGKRNGMGKEYYYNNDRLEIGGENLNDMKDSYLIFKGEYFNDRRWNGEGKEYDTEDNLIFEGEFLNGIRNGKGKEYYKNKLIFEGEYLNGIRWNGKGQEYKAISEDEKEEDMNL